MIRLLLPMDSTEGRELLAKAVEQANARLALVLAYMRGLEVLR